MGYVDVEVFEVDPTRKPVVITPCPAIRVSDRVVSVDGERVV